MDIVYFKSRWSANSVYEMKNILCFAYCHTPTGYTFTNTYLHQTWFLIIIPTDKRVIIGFLPALIMAFPIWFKQKQY